MYGSREAPPLLATRILNLSLRGLEIVRRRNIILVIFKCERTICERKLNITICTSREAIKEKDPDDG